MFQPTEKNTDIDDKDTNTGNQTSLIPEPESSDSTNNNTTGVTPNIPRTRPRYAKLDLKNLRFTCAICGKKLEKENEFPGHFGGSYCFNCKGPKCGCGLRFFHFTGYSREMKRYEPDF
ncbi:hypothetical protein BB558_000116 [Smittium angustum]|uniref:Uncharacterized protein n=1 Tax=Smittium angustum TaxID=133377 RepID=A0A2U1IXR8_SMIAN|nr:hypothetical protein BB558_006434 [Smittium angustum]PWA03698.1 hypothetical protein BB558_000116 [Smittium angustum]